MTNRKSLMVGTLAAVLTLMVGASVNGWSGTSNKVRFSGAVALPGVVLPAGEYNFLLVPGSAGVVRVTRASDNRAFYLGFTNAIARPRTLDPKRAIVLGESTAGIAPPIATWFPTDGGAGRGFIY